MPRFILNLKRVLLQKNPYHFSYLSPSWYAELLRRYWAFRCITPPTYSDTPIYVVLSSDVEFDIPCQGDPSRLSKGILKEGLSILLDILRKFDVEGTFFIEAMTGRYFPEVFDLILTQKHEVGSHGYSHYQNYAGDRYSLGRFAHPISVDEIARLINISKRMLEKATGRKVYSFRAPFARIDGHVFEILSEEGFLFDSSIPNGAFGRIFPYHPNRKKFWRQGNSKILEIPMSGRPMPSLRHFLEQSPYRTFSDLYVEDIEEAKRAFNQLVAIAECVGKPAIIHITSHSWEFATINSRIAGTVTGRMRMKRLKEFLSFLEQRNSNFVSMERAGRLWAQFMKDHSFQPRGKTTNWLGICC